MSSRPARDSFRQFDDFEDLRDHLRSVPDDALVPDLTAQILGEVGRRRGWLGRGQRRLVFATRVLIGAAALGAAAGALVLQQRAPIESASVDEPRPLGSLVRTVTTETQPMRTFVTDPAQVRAAMLERPLTAAASSFASLQRLGAANNESAASAGITPDAQSSVLLGGVPGQDASADQFGLRPTLSNAPATLGIVGNDQSWRRMDMVSPGVTWMTPTLLSADGHHAFRTTALRLAASQEEQEDEAESDER